MNLLTHYLPLFLCREMHANCSTSLPFHHQQMAYAHTLIDWQTWQPAEGYQVISLRGEDTQMSRQDDWYHTHLEQKSSQVCYYERHVSVEIPSTTVLHIPRKVSLFLLFWSVPSLLVLRLPLLLRSEILKPKYFLYSMFYGDKTVLACETVIKELRDKEVWQKSGFHGMHCTSQIPSRHFYQLSTKPHVLRETNFRALFAPVKECSDH